MLGFLQQLGPTELILILVIILLLFGAKKLPEMARSLGRSSKEFKQGLAEGAEDEPDAESGEKAADADKAAGNGKPSGNGKAG